MISTSPETSQCQQLRPVRSVYLGHRLKVARLQAGLTQEEVADRLGLDESIPSRWEAEECTRFRPVPAARLEPLARILGKSLDEWVPEALAEASQGSEQEAGTPVGMLTAADLFGPSDVIDPLAESYVSITHVLQYSSACVPTDEAAPPRPAPGRPWRAGPVEDSVPAIVHVQLRCPWCHAKYEVQKPLRSSYDRDPLPIRPGGNCPHCQRQLRAKVTVRVVVDAA